MNPVFYLWIHILVITIFGYLLHILWLNDIVLYDYIQDCTIKDCIISWYFGYIYTYSHSNKDVGFQLG